MTKTGAATFDYTPDAVHGRTLLLSSPWNIGSAQGEYVNASVTGMSIGFDEKMLGIITMYLAYNANQVARVGFGMEEAQNTIDPTRKCGMEMCGGTGINWQAVTANGLTRTTSATAMNAAPVPNDFKAYRMFFDPSDVSFKLTNQDGIVKVMTSTIPSGGTDRRPTPVQGRPQHHQHRQNHSGSCVSSLWQETPSQTGSMVRCPNKNG